MKAGVILIKVNFRTTGTIRDRFHNDNLFNGILYSYAKNIKLHESQM